MAKKAPKLQLITLPFWVLEKKKNKEKRWSHPQRHYKGVRTNKVLSSPWENTGNYTNNTGIFRALNQGPLVVCIKQGLKLSWSLVSSLPPKLTLNRALVVQGHMATSTTWSGLASLGFLFSWAQPSFLPAFEWVNLNKNIGKKLILKPLSLIWL